MSRHYPRVRDGIRPSREAKRPLDAVLCRCACPVTDGDDECIRCGRLACAPDPARRLHVVSVPSHELSMGVVANVIHGIAA